LDAKDGHSYEVDTWAIGVILYTMLVGKPPFETSDVKTTYRRIRLTAYTFPEHITISEEAKSLITRILNADPKRRPTLDEILGHSFFNKGGSIPKTLPPSTLACPPSTLYMRKFLPEEFVSYSKQRRFTETAPIRFT